RERSKSQTRAAENRARTGRTKEETARERDEAEQAGSELDNKRLSEPSPPEDTPSTG
ncbi:MAG: DUF4169 family protein, partial [Alphaproteobacteria bacterium]|nr:DUF4169 family protein [Alphaproteobacteria bacterium]